MKSYTVGILCVMALVSLSNTTGFSIDLTGGKTGNELEYEGLVAFLANNAKLVQKDDDPKPSPVECECVNGYIIHGDGHRTPCPCGAECKCFPSHKVASKKKDPVQKFDLVDKDGNRLYVVWLTAEWCLPCTTFREVYLPELIKANWTYSDIYDTKYTIIEKLDVDQHRELAVQAMGDEDVRVPTFVFIRGKKVIKRVTGLMSLGDFNNKVWE